MNGNRELLANGAGEDQESQCTTPMVDVELLEELLECLGADDFTAALDNFESDVASAMGNLLEASDDLATSRAAHRLKGLLGQFGANSATELAARVEARPQEQTQRQRLVREAREGSREVLDVGRRLLSGAGV